MKKLPKNYVIVEIIPTMSDSTKGFIAQIQALKISNNQIVERLDLRIKKDLINNRDLLNIISYDEDMFTYLDDKKQLMDNFIKFIKKEKLLIIDNFYTLDYLKNISNKKESVFNYLDMKYSDDIFDKIINKYHLDPSNHLVDLLFEALIFENDVKKEE